MKITICNTHENKGGAAKAAKRIAESLFLNRVDVSFLALEGEYVVKNENALFRKSRFFWCRLEQYQKALSIKDFSSPFSASQYSLGNTKYIHELDPDVVHLNYINNALFSVKDVSLIGRPIVWTIHDSWLFTGGCHLPLECERYKEKCGLCPLLKGNKERDLSRKVWESKNRYWKDLDIVVVSPSKWLAECVRESSLFSNARVETICNPLNTEIFTKHDKQKARRELGLNEKKKYILFGAVDPTKDRNKGYFLLKSALEKLKLENTQLLIFGSKREDSFDLDFPFKNLGFIQDEETLSKIYAAGDVTVVPSISENQPNIAIESLACGTPVVGFGIRGLEEIVLDDRFGLLAQPYSTKELGEKIGDILSEEFLHSDYISDYIRENFNFLKIGKEYKDLFESVMGKKG